MKYLLAAAVLIGQYTSGNAQKLQVSPAVNGTYRGKAMFGYQGWFAHPHDLSPRPDYWHWGNLDQPGVIPQEIEMYPDLREFCPNERYPTGYSMPDGSGAEVFSSGNRKTVMRHMKWVRDYRLDGVFLQRFISEYDDQVVMQFRDSVTTALIAGCELYNRLYAIMYDGVGDRVADIKADWMHLVDNLSVTESDRYLLHNGRPLVTLWGFTFYQNATTSQLQELINWFSSQAETKYQASIKLGLNDGWFDLDSRWTDLFKQVDVISPWSVGRFDDLSSYQNYLVNQLQPGKAWCDAENILFVPVLWPGFSWHNLTDGSGPQNQIARDGGNFFWMQAHHATLNGCESFYYAMLDELDESTAFFKTSEDDNQSPIEGYWLDLDADGYTLPSDWYLRCAGQAADVMKGSVANTSKLPTLPEGIMTVRPDHDNCGLTFIFPDFPDETQLEISLDGGASFAYTTPDHVGSYTIANLSDHEFEVMVRHPGKAMVTMGSTGLPVSCIDATTSDVLLDLDRIELHPNPFTGFFTIRGLTDHFDIDILNSLGQSIENLEGFPDIQIDLSNLPNGLYLIRIRHRRLGAVRLEKIIKS